MDSRTFWWTLRESSRSTKVRFAVLVLWIMFTFVLVALLLEAL